MKKVMIVNGSPAYYQMFIDMGWEISFDINKADVVQFTGGEDISPNLYGEKAHHETYSNPYRDESEIKIFNECVELGKPMVGICRGGQFLNVMNGGKMWQHTTGHGILGTHEAMDIWTHETFNVTSTHHQIMRVGNSGIVVALASGLSDRFEHMVDGKLVAESNQEEVEVAYYHKTRSLCFQPHPEFQDNDALECRAYYFDCIERYIFEGV